MSARVSKLIHLFPSRFVPSPGGVLSEAPDDPRPPRPPPAAGRPQRPLHVYLLLCGRASWRRRRSSPSLALHLLLPTNLPPYISAHEASTYSSPPTSPYAIASRSMGRPPICRLPRGAALPSRPGGTRPSIPPARSRQKPRRPLCDSPFVSCSCVGRRFALLIDQHSPAHAAPPTCLMAAPPPMPSAYALRPRPPPSSPADIRGRVQLVCHVDAATTDRPIRAAPMS
ncbi:proline-rich receptor-like protein kinase PERK10 [Penaeus japonicus]|uniref:proline-rich receptor-like protein kinase PERK10 n=1 Tax=Penaeus japonicus TaxID=27405 RepID=UPI001C716FDE|nr:proline-rich receptor-like protein kinase PERK10 [Penaeus japonicus]